MFFKFLKLFFGGVKELDFDVANSDPAVLQLIYKEPRHTLRAAWDMSTGNLLTVDHSGNLALRGEHGESEPCFVRDMDWSGGKEVSESLGLFLWLIAIIRNVHAVGN